MDNTSNQRVIMPPFHTKIHILGAGIGGLTLARCLGKRGVQSVVFEKNPSPARHNYGLSLREGTRKALGGVLGVQEGMLAGSVGIGKGGVREGGVRAHRGKLEALLRKGVDVRWGHVLGGIQTTDTNQVVLDFENGECVRSTCVVDATGVHSPVRKALLPGVKVDVLPYVVFRGTRRVEQTVFEKVYEERIGGGQVAELRVGEVLLQVSVNEFRADGEVDISYVYSRPARANDTLHRPDRKTDQADVISDAFYGEVTKLEGLEGLFGDAFEEGSVRKGRTLHWLMRDCLVPLSELKVLQSRGVWMLGDAAHALPILGGYGAEGAIGDAVALADALVEGRLMDFMRGGSESGRGVSRWGGKS